AYGVVVDRAIRAVRTAQQPRQRAVRGRLRAHVEIQRQARRLDGAGQDARCILDRWGEPESASEFVRQPIARAEAVALGAGTVRAVLPVEVIHIGLRARRAELVGPGSDERVV